MRIPDVHVRIPRLTLSGNLLFIATLLLPLTGFAQVGEQQTSGGELEVVTVTAQRREQSLLEVPISITVFNAEQIEQAGWLGARDFVLLSPNVFFSENDQQGTKNGDISIRGISDLTAGANERAIQTRPAIGYYVDEVSVASVSSGGANPPLGDLERIEILRGPQVTYFGRSAAGGAINIVTKKPDENEMLKIKAGYGSFDTYQVGVIGNTPLAEDLYIRGGISYIESDGLIKNLSPTGNNADTEFLNARLALRWQPGDWTIDLTGQLTREDEGNLSRIPTGPPLGGPAVGVSGNPPLPAATCGLGDKIYYPGNTRRICENADTYTTVDNDFFTLRANYAAEKFTFVSITGYLTSEFDQFEDLDNSGMDIFNRLDDYESQSFNQEFRVASASPVKIGSMDFNWTFGTSYYNDDFNTKNRIISGTNVAPNFVGSLTVPGDRPNENNQFVKRDGWAVFADFDLNLSESWALELGGRYSQDNDEQYWTDTYASFTCGTRQVVGGVAAPFRPGCALRPDQTLPLPIYQNPAGNYYVTGGRFAQTQYTSGENDGNDFSPRVALNWSIKEDQSAYLTYSQGYRPPGVRVNPDAQMTGPNARDLRSFYGKEKVYNYEAGWKGYLSDRRLLLELAVFQMDWKDMQVRLSRTLCQEPDGTFVPIEDGSPQCSGLYPDNTVQNAESARSRGAELNFTALATEKLTLSGAFGYLDAEFTDFTNSAVGDVTGLQMPNSPKWSAAGGAQYDWTSKSGNVSGYLKALGAYKSSTYVRFQDVKQPNDSIYRADAHFLLNLSAGIAWGNQYVDLNVNNVLGKEYIAGVDSFSSLGPVVLPHPTTWLITWTAEFGGGEPSFSSPAAPPPPPPPPAAPPANPDLDGDGVLNERDKCPNTRPGAVVDLDGCEVEAVIALEGVHFAFNEATLTPQAMAILDKAAGLLKTNERVVVEVAGHTDSVGSEEYNQSLSERRAIAVKNYLEGQGITATRLTARGYGEAQPVASNDTDEGRALNRRVELIVLDR